MSLLDEQGGTTPETAATPAAPSQEGTGTTNSDASPSQAPQSSSGQDNPANAPAEPKSMAEVIEAALAEGTKAPESTEGEQPAATAPEAKATDPAAPASADPAKSNGTVENGSGDADLADPTEQEISELKPKIQKRVRQLLADRHTARRDADGLRGDAGNYRQIRQFMEQNSLGDQEVAELFQIGADLKSGDPTRLAKFLDRVMPTVQQVLEATGRSVPRDLREQVTRGDMTEDAARRFGQERFQRVAAEDRANRASQHVVQRDQAATVASVQNAVATWEQQVRATDPDFDLKAKAMSRAARAIVAERGLPKSPEQALEYAKRAYEDVNEDFRLARPAPKPTRPAPASGPSANPTGLAPAPNSLEEIIKTALGGTSR